MAYHYLVNRDTAETKTIRTESLDMYNGAGSPWSIFDTESERDAKAATLLQWCVDLSNGKIFSLTKQRARDYERHIADRTRYGEEQSYSLHPTEAEAKAACPVFVWTVQLSDGNIRQRKQAAAARLRASDYQSFDTEAAAREYRKTLNVWVVNLVDGSVNMIGPDDASYYRNDTHNYIVYPWDQEAAAREYRLPPRFVWDNRARKYVTWTRELYRATSIPRPAIAPFVTLRECIRNAANGDASDVLPIRAAIEACERTRVLGPRGRMARRARLMARVSALLAGMRREGSEGQGICTCLDCAQIILTDGAAFEYGGGYVCHDCSSDYSRCYECEEMHPNRDMVEYDDEMYCEAHIPEEYEPSGGSGATLDYGTDIMRLRSGFRLAKGEKCCPVWLGVELEVHHKDSVTKAAAIQNVNKLAGGFTICKRDGSLKEGGFEIVTVPGSLAWHRQETMPFLLKAAPWIEGWRHTDCGMHVHVGKEQLSELTLGKLVVFMHEPENQAFITALAGRDVNSYAKRPGTKKTLPAYRREADLGRYQALNFATRGRKTIEFRIFRSNVSPAGFMKNLEFVAAVCDWCKLASPYEVASHPAGIALERDEKKLEAVRPAGYSNFVRWASEHRSDYPYLCKWLEENGYLSSKRASVSPSLAA